MKAGGDNDGIWAIMESGLQYVIVPKVPSVSQSLFVASAQSCRMSHTSLGL